MAKKKKKKAFDLDEHIAELRAIISDEATQQNWRKLCENIAAIPADAQDELKMFIDYAEQNLDHWPEELRKPLYPWWKAKQNKEELEVHRLVGNFENHPLITTADIDDLVPDRAALKRSKSVAKAAKWESFGRDKECLWGIAIGSSSTYAVWVDARSETLECNCPSRVRPCKHSVGILLMDSMGIEFPDKEAPSGHRWEAEERYNSWE